jgi:cytochrome c6
MKTCITSVETRGGALQVCLFLLLTIMSPTKTNSQDKFETGEGLFNSSCNVCHVGGNNIIIPEKNLRKKSLEANGMNNLEAIVYQVTNGKNGMPAFGGRLKETEIEKVAIYVLQEFGKKNEN